MSTEILTMISSLDTKITAALIAAVIGVLGIFFTIFTYFNDFKRRNSIDRQESINKQLNEFYGPLLSYLTISKSLYLIFKSNKPQELRLLTYLLDKNQLYNGTKVTLTSSDEDLIKEIIAISSKIEELIILKSGLIEDKKLTYKYENDTFQNITNNEIEVISVFSILLTHFKVVKMAYEKKFDNNSYDIDNLSKFVYPRILNKMITTNIEELQLERKKI